MNPEQYETTEAPDPNEHLTDSVPTREEYESDVDQDPHDVGYDPEAPEDAEPDFEAEDTDEVEEIEETDDSPEPDETNEEES